MATLKLAAAAACMLVFLALTAPVVPVLGDAATSAAVYKELQTLSNQNTPQYIVALKLLKQACKYIPCREHHLRKLLWLHDATSALKGMTLV